LSQSRFIFEGIMGFIAEKITAEWIKKMPEQASEINSNNF
jgi:hypothetical protein